jgi:hypothetical protein
VPLLPLQQAQHVLQCSQFMPLYNPSATLSVQHGVSVVAGITESSAGIMSVV